MAAQKAVVLLVDDSCEVRAALTYALRAGGYRTAIAPDGAAALARLRAGLSPCVILLDLDMPRKGGLAFREEQLADPRLAAIPVAAYSGSAHLRPHAESLGLPFFDKTVDEGPLLEFVSLHCGAGGRSGR